MSISLKPEKIDVVILCGGKGKRLQPVVSDRPKPMAEINGQPFLDILIEHIASFGFRRFILCIGYMGSFIKQYYQNRKDYLEILFSQEKEPLGTAGAIKKAGSLIRSSLFLVMNGDSFLDLDFNQIIAFHKEKKAITTIGLVYANDVSRYGKVEINSENEVISFDDKSSVGDGIVNGGLYVFNRKIIDYIPTGRVSLENEVLPILIKRGLYGMVVNGFFVDIGKPEDFLKLNEDPKKLLNVIRS